MITNAGKAHIKRYLAGQVGAIGESIALGIGNAAESATSVDMTYEIARVDVSLVSYDFVNDVLIFKGELDQSLAGTIYEVGLWSADVDTRADGYASRLLASFDSDTETWSAGSYFTTNARVGIDSLRLAPAASTSTTATLSDVTIDLSGHSGVDTFSLAYFVGGTAPASVVVRFKTDTANYYTWTITSPTAGYRINTVTKASLVATGTPQWDNITSIEVVVTAAAGGAAAVDLDALRVNDVDTENPDYVLVAREVLAAPHVKTEGIIQEIEFAIPVAIA